MDVSRIARPLRACIAAGAVLAGLSLAGAPARASESDSSAVVTSYGEMLASSNSRLSLGERRVLAERVLLLSSYYELDPRLLIALVSVESAWRTHAMSPVGARGLGQLMPGTAAALDVNAFETYENLDGTARYLRRLLMRYPTYAQRVRYRYALAAYNAGPGAVDRYHGIPPYAETQSYVTHVMALWDRFTRTAALPPHSALAYAQRTPAPIQHVVRAAPHAKPKATSAAFATPTQAPDVVLVAYATPAPVQTAEYEPRRGLFGFLHRRRRVEHPQTPSPAEGDHAIAAQSAFYRPMPRSALRHY